MRNPTAKKVEHGQEERPIALSLSGGGFRATLFHVGVLAFLVKTGRLGRVTHISGVSGGSIIAADLVLHWEDYCDPERFWERVERILTLVSVDVRGRILRRLPYLGLCNFLASPLSLVSRRRSLVVRSVFSRSGMLRLYLRRYLYGTRDISELGGRDRPHLALLATNLSSGGGSAFTPTGLIPDYSQDDQPVPLLIPVDLAVAASACFAGLFPPLRLRPKDYWADTAIPGVPEIVPAKGSIRGPEEIALTDGGVFDNLGIRWISKIERQRAFAFHRIVLSDASGSFDWHPSSRFRGLLGTAIRAADIMMRALRNREHEKLSSQRIRLVSIDSTVEQSDDYPIPELAQRQIKNIRTDLDVFTPEEIRALVGHGFEVASEAFGEKEHAAASELPEAVRPNPIKAQFTRRLAAGRSRKLRLFSLSDPFSYLSLALLVLVGWSIFWVVLHSNRFPHFGNKPATIIALIPSDEFGAQREVGVRLALSGEDDVDLEIFRDHSVGQYKANDLDSLWTRLDGVIREKNVAGVIGPSISEATDLVLEEIGRRLPGLPVFVESSVSAAELSTIESRVGVLRLNSGVDVRGKEIADFLRLEEAQGRRIAFVVETVGDDDSYGQKLQDEIRRSGFTASQVTYYPFRRVLDEMDAIRSLVASSDLVLVLGLGGDFVSIVKEVYAADGLGEPRADLVGVMNAFALSDFFKKNEVYHASKIFDFTDLDLGRSFPATDAALYDTGGVRPRYEERDKAMSFDAARCFVDGIRRLNALHGRPVGKHIVVDARRREELYSLIQTQNYEGVAGSIDFDESGLNRRVRFREIRYDQQGDRWSEVRLPELVH